MIPAWSQFVSPHGTGGPHSLCRTFDEIAIRTHGWLTTSRAPRLVPGETAITDLNLFELWYRHRSEVSIWRMTPAQERATGADWEWWLGGPGKWAAFRIQAKKLDNGGREYRGLRASAGSGRRQIDALIDSAARSRYRALPAYCFYNGSLSVPVSWRPSCRNRLLPTVIGCTFALAADVRAAKSIKVADVATHSLPWSDLVCCGSGSLADRVAAAVHRMEADPAIHGELPDYARLVQTGELLEEDQRIPEGLIGILVVEESRIAVL